jgi:hypothetical protein
MSERTDGSTSPRGARAQHLRTTVAWGARVGVVTLSTWVGSGLSLPLGPAADLVAGALLGLALLGLGSLLWSLLRWIAIDWARVVGAAPLIATLGVAALLIGFVRLPAVTALLTWGVWLAAGLGLTVLVLGLRRAARGPGRPIGALGALAGLALGAAALGWWWHPGAPDGAAPLDAAGVAPLELADPGAPGPFAVETLRYGTGLPSWRSAYGDATTILTAPIDLADLVDLGPVAGPLRRAALGFGLDEVPRNAVVYVPADADGPHPLVLVMHGNANLFVASEEGYAWLGEHLASHGMVVASVDAAAFNALPLVGGSAARTTPAPCCCCRTCSSGAPGRLTPTRGSPASTSTVSRSSATRAAARPPRSLLRSTRSGGCRRTRSRRSPSASAAPTRRARWSRSPPRTASSAWVIARPNSTASTTSCCRAGSTPTSPASWASASTSAAKSVPAGCRPRSTSTRPTTVSSTTPGAAATTSRRSARSSARPR